MMRSLLSPVLALFKWQPVVLNNGNSNNSPVGQSDPQTIVRNLKSRMLRLKGSFLSDDGSKVNYDDMRESEDFNQFIDESANLMQLNLSSLDVSSRKATCINTYNCLVLHGLGKGLLTKYDTLSRLKFYGTMSYNIGGNIYSLNDIEHGLLRGNALSPVPLSSPPFNNDDPRKLLVLPLDPRIHFALNCAAKSCPPISVYSFDESELENQLDMATEAFLSQTVTVLPGKGARLSMLFKWYKSDFGSSDRDVLQWISGHCSAVTSEQIKELLIDCSRPEITYDDYDWGLNN